MLRVPTSASPSRIQTGTMSGNARLASCILGALAITMSMAASAAGDVAAPTGARYQQERSVCLTGQSNQDAATCLKEAGAAKDENRRGGLNDSATSYQQNAMQRCNALPASDREACQRRISGEGMTSGTARDGGVMRELVTPVAPGTPGATPVAPAPGSSAYGNPAR